MHMMFFMQNMVFIENMNKDIIKQKTRKKITFDNVVNVILIPCAKEMESIKNEIWWSKIDYATFYVSARKELRDFMEENSPINRVQAMKLLYQPSTIHEDLTATNCSAQI